MPIKIMKFNKYKHKHYTYIIQGLLKYIIYRDSLNKQLKMSNSNSTNYEVILTNFETFNSILKKNIRAAKKVILSYALFQNDTRNTWKIINEVLSNDKANKLFYFKENYINITDKTGIANKFNNHFTSIGQTIAQRIQYDGNKYYSYYLKKRVDSFQI